MSRKAAKTVHLQEFADDHGVTVRTVTNWIAEGMPHRNVRGERRVVRAEGNAWRLDRERRRAIDKAAGGRWDKDEEMAKRIRVDRLIREMELRKLERTLLPAAAFDERLDRIAGGFAAVAMGQLQQFERLYGLEPGAARALTLKIQAALMQGAQELADTLDAEAAALQQLEADETASGDDAESTDENVDSDTDADADVALVDDIDGDPVDVVPVVVDDRTDDNYSLGL